MHSHEIWVIETVFKAKGSCQFHLSKPFQYPKSQRGIQFAACNQIVAMITVLQGKIIGRNRIPESYVFERCQPFLHVLNIFKNNHGNILPNHGIELQICDEVEVAQ